MKKVMAIMLSAAMLLLVSAVPLSVFADDSASAGEAEEVIYFEENFDSPTLTPDTVSEGQPAVDYQTLDAEETFNGWVRGKTTGYTDDSVFRIVPDASKTPAGQALYVSRSANANTNSAQIGISASLNSEIDRTKPVKIAFRFKRSSAQNATSIGVGGIWLTIDGYGSNGSAARIYGANAMSGNAKTLAIASNVWHNMEYIADCSAGTYVLNILDADGNATSSVSGSLTLSAANTTVMIRTIRNGYFSKDESTEFDDIKVYREIPADPNVVYDADISPKVSGVWTKQLSLPQTTLDDAKIEWTSDDFYIEFGSQITAESTPKTGTLKATIKDSSTEDVICERTYKTTLIPETVYFYENFEYASSASWEGYNGWTKTHYSGNSDAYMKPYFSEITTDSSNMVGRLYKKVASTGNFSDIVMVKNFENTSSDISYSVKLKFKTSSTSNFFRVQFGNTASKISFLFDPNNRRIFQSEYNNSYIVGYVPEGKNTSGQWHTIEFIIDAMGNNKFDLYYDDVLVAENKVYLNNVSVADAITNVAFGVLKTNWGDVDADVLFDDVTVSASDKVFSEYLIKGFEFKNADNALCKNAESNGRVTGLEIENFLDRNDKGIVVVYENGNKLYDAATFDTNNIADGKISITGLDIPENIENLSIKAFVWDGFNVLKPITEPKEYEWSKVKLFVSGDSIAESVASNAVRGGWGDYIEDYFDDTQIEAVNTSVGGMTAKVALTDSARFPRVVNEGTFGDYVLISYAHNDDGKTIRLMIIRQALELWSKKQDLKISLRYL